VLSLLLLCGCAIDKGTALAADFNEAWAGTPDVTKIHTTENNTLPFAGTATGTLVLKDGTPADRVTGLANDLRRYVAEHRTTTGRITAGSVTFTVVADQERADEVLALWRSLTADDRMLTGDISDASTKEAARWRIELTAAADAVALFKDVVADGEQHRPLSDVMSLRIRAGRDARPGVAVETDFNGTLPTEAIAAYEAVAARYTVVRAFLTPDRASIVVAKDAEQARAHELAEAAAPGLGADVKVTSDSGP
jgi:hypothetical protein